MPNRYMERINLFRQAAELLKAKDAGNELSEEELQLIGTATIPLMVKGCPFPENITIGEGLLELVKIVEEVTNEKHTAKRATG